MHASCEAKWICIKAGIIWVEVHVDGVIGVGGVHRLRSVWRAWELLQRVHGCLGMHAHRYRGSRRDG